MRETIEEAQEAAPILCQDIARVFFHLDAPSFSHNVLPRGNEWPALPARSDTAHAALALTETDAPKPATPAAVGSGKRNSNCARPMDGQTTSTSLPADPDSDVKLVAIIGESDGDSDYVESAENSPPSLANTPDLAGHIIEMGAMHKVLE